MRQGRYGEYPRGPDLVPQWTSHHAVTNRLEEKQTDPSTTKGTQPASAEPTRHDAPTSSLRPTLGWMQTGLRAGPG